MNKYNTPKDNNGNPEDNCGQIKTCCMTTFCIIFKEVQNGHAMLCRGHFSCTWFMYLFTF